MFVSLDEVKRHLRIDEFFKEDDEYIRQLIDVAEQVVEKHIDCDYTYLLNDVGQIPSPLRHAILFCVGNFYENRESIASTQYYNLPHTFDYLIDLYRDYSFNKQIKPSIKNKIDHSFDGDEGMMV